MKTYITIRIFAFLLLITSFTAFSQKKNSITLPSTTTDIKRASRYINPLLPAEAPNLDPTWNWTACCNGNTMYYSLNNSTPIALYNVQLPFYTQGNALADALTNDSKDMWSEDGWMLVYKDFGSPTSAPPLPFFALYNKYKGVLRIMVYNAPAISNSYVKMELSFRESSPKSALFTFTEQRYLKQTLNDFDNDIKSSIISDFEEGQGWAYGDFIISYVPNLDKRTVLHLDIDRIDETTLTANGKLSLEEVIKSSPGGSGNSLSTGLSVVSTGYKSYSGVSKAAKDLGISAAAANIYGVVGSVLSLVNYFITGKNKDSGKTPLSFKGTTTLTGTLSTARDLASYDLALFSDISNLPDYYRPLQNIPWGVFNVVELSNTYYDYRDYYETCDNGQAGWSTYVTLKVDSLKYIVNPNIDMTLKKGYYITEFPGSNLIGLTGQQLKNQFFWVADNNYCYGNYVGPYGYLEKLHLELTFQINKPTKNYDKEVVFHKAYIFHPSAARLATQHKSVMSTETTTIYPTPFSKSVTLSFLLRKGDKIEAKIVDTKGSIVKTFEITSFENKTYEYEWDGKDNNQRDLPSGIYFLKQYKNNSESISKKIIKI